MQKLTKKMIVDICMNVIGTLVLIFMCICIFAHQTWALYVEIALALPYWTLVSVEIIMWVNEKDRLKKNEKH